MPVQTLTITPEYLSIYAAGHRKVDIPLHMDRQGIFASPDCINIPALPWNEGDTHLTFGPASEIMETRRPDFDGVLNTPNNEIVLFDAIEPEFAISQVPSTKMRIRVWINHPASPDHVTIAWG